MRQSLILGCLGWAMAVSGVLAEGPLAPSSGYVAIDSLKVRSGPGEEFYATSELQRGSPVEIYRQHAGGWLAIRPPEGSHAWVAADALRATDDSPVALVKRDLVEAWVGSDMPGVRSHLWQVRLDRDEAVRLLGEQRLVTRADRGRETWLKIAPPAGEFRYVHREGVELRTGGGDANVRPAAHSSPAGQMRPRRDEDAPSVSESVTLSAESLDAAAPENDAGELANIDVALSYMVAQPLQTWDLAPLKRRADAVANSGRTPLERGHARRMLEEIAEFEDLHYRWRLGASVEAASFEISSDDADAESDRPADAAEGEVGTGIASSEAKATTGEFSELQYDGAGRLRKVYSKNRVAPPYVLVDEDNNVLRFVTPAPGLNLHRYLEEEVGVFGQVGRTPALDAPLITAQRIVRLDRHRQ